MAVNGERIRQLRLGAGLTQDSLGKKLGVIKQTVSSWENGISEPNSEVLSNMASLFNVTVDDLLGCGKFSHAPKDGANHFFFFFDDIRKTIFSNRIKAALAEKQMTENDFIEQISINQEKASAFLSGEEDPTADDLIEISQFLGFSIDYLLGQVPEISNSERKMLNTFIKLNEDNQDIIIGKAKELLKEQESVAADKLLEKTGTTNSAK